MPTVLFLGNTFGTVFASRSRIRVYVLDTHDRGAGSRNWFQLRVMSPVKLFCNAVQRYSTSTKHSRLSFHPIYSNFPMNFSRWLHYFPRQSRRY